MTSHSQRLHVTSQEPTYLLGFHARRAACCLAGALTLIVLYRSKSPTL